MEMVRTTAKRPRQNTLPFSCHLSPSVLLGPGGANIVVTVVAPSGQALFFVWRPDFVFLLS